MCSVGPLLHDPSQQLTGAATLFSLSMYKKGHGISDLEAMY